MLYCQDTYNKALPYAGAVPAPAPMHMATPTATGPHHVQGGGLARSAGPQEAEALPLSDGQRHARHRSHLPAPSRVHLPQVVADDGVGGKRVRRFPAQKVLHLEGLADIVVGGEGQGRGGRGEWNRGGKGLWNRAFFFRCIDTISSLRGKRTLTVNAVLIRWLVRGPAYSVLTE